MGNKQQPMTSSNSILPETSNDKTDKAHSSKLWMPKRVLFTPDAINEPFGQKIYERVTQLNLPTEILKNNRITGLRGETERETYKIAKTTLAIVKAAPRAYKLMPIPPSADFQFHLAEGCPAHCQYCYLAGSLSGPPTIRVFANLPDILENTTRYERSDRVTSFEASCYTDPLSLEHLTGSLSETIRFFGQRPSSHLRFVTKFDAIESLIGIEHNGRTRCRVSLNAEIISRRLEGGTPDITRRIKALRKLALPKEEGGGAYPIGVVLAPIMPIPNWKDEYGKLLDNLKQALNFSCDHTFELITHRFTPGSKDVLLSWYPNTSLNMDEAARSVKTNKFGGRKFVYQKDMMDELKKYFYQEIGLKFPDEDFILDIG
jgi:spore photoproduct lyase